MSDDAVIECKTAAKSYTVQRSYIKSLYNEAVRQGKEAVLILEFPDYELTITINRRTQ